jgi:hypothetical protein
VGAIDFTTKNVSEPWLSEIFHGGEGGCNLEDIVLRYEKIWMFNRQYTLYKVYNVHISEHTTCTVTLYEQFSWTIHLTSKRHRRGGGGF